MAEEKKEPKVSEETPKELGIVERAEKANQEMKELLARQEAILKRQEEIETKRIMSGRSEAGITPEKPKEDTPQEYAEKLLKGEVNPFKVE